MNQKIVFLFFFVSCAWAREYPAGLFPALCPDYPNCDNALLSRYHPDGQPKNLAYDAPALHLVRAAEYPAGVSAASCPNYPFCNVGIIAEPLPGYSQRLYPAGVSASACPNYPYC